MRTNYIWIVEMWMAHETLTGRGTDRWEPTVGAGVTKADAVWKRREWCEKNPDDRFRIRRYEAVGR